MIQKARFRAKVQKMNRVAIPVPIIKSHDWLHEGGTVDVEISPPVGGR